MPQVKCENTFGESYGKITNASLNHAISRGFEMSPDEKYQSVAQMAYTDQYELARQMRPADKFEPGYDTITFQPPRKNFEAPEPSGQIHLSYAEAQKLAFGQEC